MREQHPVIGGLLLRIAGPRQSTEAFRVGAEGEREVAQALRAAAGEQVAFLYNRRRGTGRTRGDIDLIAIAPSGVHVIDPKKYVGRKVRASPAGDSLMIDGRRHVGLATSMRKQLDVVTEAVLAGPCPQAAVRGAYCFLGADLPWRSLVVDGVPALGLLGVKKRLAEPGPLDARSRGRLHADLARRLPPA